MQWIPVSSTGGMSTAGVPLGQVKNIWFYEDIDTFDIRSFSEEQVISLETFRMYHPHRKVSIYRTNRPLARQMKA